MLQIAQPNIHMQLCVVALEAMIELYHEEFGCNPTTVIYGNWSREIAIAIFHSVPENALMANIVGVLSQVYYIPHLESRWGVLGVEGMVMSEGA